MQFRGGGGGVNEVVRQAARMQRKVEQARAEVRTQEVTSAAAGDKVKATVSCEGKVTRYEIDATFLANEGLEMALDALAAATNAALDAAEKVVEAHVAKATGGMKLPAGRF